jgi:hypothetical protein
MEKQRLNGSIILNRDKFKILKVFDNLVYVIPVTVNCTINDVDFLKHNYNHTIWGAANIFEKTYTKSLEPTGNLYLVNFLHFKKEHIQNYSSPKVYFLDSFEQTW